MASALESFIAKGQAQQASSEANVTAALKMLATNKDLRIFLQAICRYSKGDWAKTVRACKILYNVAQSSLLVTSDAKILDEIIRVPHFAAFFARITEDCGDAS